MDNPINPLDNAAMDGAKNKLIVQQMVDDMDTYLLYARLRGDIQAEQFNQLLANGVDRESAATIVASQ